MSAHENKALCALPEQLKPDGTLIIIGGHEDKEGECLILKEVVSRLLPQGKLVISTVASKEPQEYFDTYRKVFKKLNLNDTRELYIEDRSESMDGDRINELEDAAGIFFTGGDQLRISHQMGNTPFESRVKDIYMKGGVVAGTSAGASAMGETMLVRGGNSGSCRVGELQFAPGMGLLPGVIIDQHFAERGRIGRLLGAVALHPRTLGIGIDEDTAIVVRDNQFQVIGAGAVYIVDGCSVAQSNVREARPDTALSIFGVKIHVLSSGDCFNLNTRIPSTGAASH